jgi:magnesium chelatase family protein
VTAHAWGAVLTGVEASLIKAEVDIAQGLPGVGVIGLAHTAVGEARWRIRSAFGSCGIRWPLARITINLAPADLPKRGTGLDLAIAVGLLRALDEVPDAPDGVFLGELGLDGALRHVPGAIAGAAAARRCGLTDIFVPVSAAAEANAVPGMTVTAVRDLDHCRAILRGTAHGDTWQVATPLPCPDERDFADVRGHELARFGLEVAAAGEHHVCMIGPPGIGKTMLAERLPGLLPELSADAALEVTTIASLHGDLPAGAGLLTRPPFQAPHHAASQAALLGTIRGGLAIPGAVTRAHRGVLFLDEAPEFARPTLEGLRQPLESGVVTIARAGGVVTLPARTHLVLAANPCPCGLGVDDGRECRCAPTAVQRYRARLSGPLLDRIDVRLRLGVPARGALPGETTALMGERVMAARLRAAHRFRHESWSTNRDIPPRRLRTDLAPDAGELLNDHRSWRGADRTARMSWTICDLRGGQRPNRDDVASAIVLRDSDDVAG